MPLSVNGISGNHGQLPSIPENDSFDIIPLTNFGLNGLSQSTLDDIADPLPWVYHDPGTTNFRIDSPNFFGYDIKGKVWGDLTFGASLSYTLNLGDVHAEATITSALPDFADDDSNGVGDVYTSYILDTNRTRFDIGLISIPPAPDAVVAGVYLDTKGHIKVGLEDVGVYDDGDPYITTGDALLFDRSLNSHNILFEIKQNDPGRQLAAKGVTGFLNVPRLPMLEADVVATGKNVYTAASSNGLGPDFANLTIDPIAYIPVIGDINSGSNWFIQSWLIDAGIEYTLITADISLHLALNQAIELHVTDVAVTATVEEYSSTQNMYLLRQTVTGHVGDKLQLNFTPGDRYSTRITETYDIKIHVETEIGITAIGTLLLGLLHFEGIINPKGIDEIRKTFDLLALDPMSLELGTITLVDGGYDLIIHAAPMVHTIDTHVPVSGSNDDDVLLLSEGQKGIDGMGGDDILVGNDIRNIINGGAGDDLVSGAGGNDELHGGDGADRLQGQDGNDQLYTEGYSDPLQAETARGGDGNDEIFAGATRGNYRGESGDDWIFVDMFEFGGQVMEGGSGIDNLSADFSGFYADLTIDLSSNTGAGIFVPASTSGITILESSYSDFEWFDITGGHGRDILTGSSSQDYLDGGLGDDVVHGSVGDDYVFGGPGNDTVYGDPGDDVVSGDAGDDQLHGGAGNDGMQGLDGDDDIDAGTGADIVSGDNGDDILRDGDNDTSDDLLEGGRGHDVLYAGGGHDTLKGGFDNDELHAGSGTGDLHGDDGDDHLFASANARLYGGAGSDTFELRATDTGVLVRGEDMGQIGDAGQDRLVLAQGVTAIGTMPFPGYDFVALGFNGGTFYGIDGQLSNASSYFGIEAFSVRGTSEGDAIITGAGEDVIRGGSGDDYLDGGAGTDSLYGEIGDDVLVGNLGDRFYGGGGFDTVYLRLSTAPNIANVVAPVTLSVGAGDSVTIVSGGIFGSQPIVFAGSGSANAGTVFSSIERIVMLAGNDGDDSLTGGIGGDVFLGGRGDDRISGADGDDTIFDENGRNSISGGDGDDYIDARSTDTLVTRTVGVRAAGTEIYGGAGRDTIHASNTASLIYGDAGDDTITVQTGGYLGGFVTRIDGGAGNDTITGSDEAETIFGGLEPDDAPDAGSRDEVLALVEGYGPDDDLIFAGGGSDTVHGGLGSDFIDTGAGTDTAHGGSGDDQIFGNDNDTLFGDDGADRLHVAFGMHDALLDGGAGIDTADFDLTDLTQGLRYDAALLTTRLGDRLTLRAVEQLSATFTSGDDDVTAGAHDDVIAGGMGDDVLHGGGGDDILYSNAMSGLRGRAGEADELDGGAGDDLLSFSNGGIAQGGAGLDTLRLEGLNAEMSGFVLGDGSGSVGDRYIAFSGIEQLDYTADRGGPAVHVTGGVRADRLSGTGGADVLNGVRGSDTLSGGSGDDTLMVGLPADGASQTYIDGGYDTDLLILDFAAATTGYTVRINGYSTPAGPGGTVPANPQPFQFLGIERSQLTLGGGDDYVVGSAGDDIIRGGLGDDIVSAGSGDDLVYLGAGNDYVTDSAPNGGHDQYFGQDGDDEFRLGGNSATVESGAGDDRIYVAEFFYGTPAYDTPDRLSGGDGDDLISSTASGVFDGGAGLHDRIVISLARTSGQNLSLVSGASYTFGTNWSIAGFEEYWLTFGGGNDTVAVNYGRHDLAGGGGTDAITIRVDAAADARYTVSTDPAGESTYSFTNGMVVRGFETVTIQRVNTPAIANPDAFAATESVNVAIDPLANDVEDDGGPLAITAVNDVALAPGQLALLPSGASITMLEDGRLSYDPNGAFAWLVAPATGTLTGAASQATDGFTYRVSGGARATVTVTITGEDGPGDRLTGSAGDDHLTITPALHYADMSAGGDDVVQGSTADDAIWFGDAFDQNDRVDGGAGTHDQIGLQGDYDLTLGAATITGIETIAMLPGGDYTITLPASVNGGAPLTFYAGTLEASDSFTMHAAASTNALTVFGSLGADRIETGSADDKVYFGPDRFDPAEDHVDGGAGADQLAVDGDYVLDLDGQSNAGFETFVLLPGTAGEPAQYAVTVKDDWAEGGAAKMVYAVETVTGVVLNGAAEDDSVLDLFGGFGADRITAGQAGGRLSGGGGADLIQAGAGIDRFLFNAGESTSLALDRVSGFDGNIDRIVLFGNTVVAFDGNLNAALDTTGDLTALLGNLGAHHAATVTAIGGQLAGAVFVIVNDAAAGYGAGTDLLVQMDAMAAPITGLASFA